jgi:NAD(P) transhydrogenase
MSEASAEHYDLVVIGGGPAGEKGAAQAAYFGKRVALIEQAPQLGGAGINTGTVPSKTLRETALYFSGLRQRGLYGIDYSVKKELSVRDFMYRETHVVQELRELVRANLVRHRIDLVRGQASFDDTHRVRVRSPSHPDRVLHGDVILIATGSVPTRPGNMPFHDPRLFDSDSILAMDRIPSSMAVVGAGIIGCEYGTMFAALGVAVTVIDGRERLLSFLDAEIADRLLVQMGAVGVRVRLRESIQTIEPNPGSLAVKLAGGTMVNVDAVLFAAGRAGNTQGLGLDTIGVSLTERGAIKVNEHYQTPVPHIYAAGDVLGFPALASTSMEQARVAIVHAFDLKYKTRVAPIFPMAIYTIPEVAMVGETEESCQRNGIDYVVGNAWYRHNARGQITGDLTGQLKLVFARGDKRLLGVHVVGESASELIHVGLMVLQAGGSLETFIDTVFNYPTLGEMYKYAAYDGLDRLGRH